MAETKKPARPRKTKRSTRRPAAKAGPRKAAAKPSPAKAKPRNARATPRPPRSRLESSGFDGLAKLIDHPLVADLLTVGDPDMPVAAIADHNVKTRTGESEAGSSKAVKAAGKAAATAIGKRLITEAKQIRKSSESASRGSE